MEKYRPSFELDANQQLIQDLFIYNFTVSGPVYFTVSPEGSIRGDREGTDSQGKRYQRMELFSIKNDEPAIALYFKEDGSVNFRLEESPSTSDLKRTPEGKVFLPGIAAFKKHAEDEKYLFEFFKNNSSQDLGKISITKKGRKHSVNLLFESEQYGLSFGIHSGRNTRNIHGNVRLIAKNLPPK